MTEIIKHKIGLMLVSLVLVLSVLSMSLAPKVSAAVSCDGLTGTEASKCQVCKGSGGENYSNGTCSTTTEPDPEGTVSDIVTDVINIFSWVVGIAAVIMIMVGGFKYITSQGDSGNISGAKNTILYAIVGLVVVAFAQIIVRFVISKV